VRNHGSPWVDCTRCDGSGLCRRHKGRCRWMCSTLLHSQRMLMLSRAPVRHLHDSGRLPVSAPTLESLEQRHLQTTSRSLSRPAPTRPARKQLRFRKPIASTTICTDCSICPRSRVCGDAALHVALQQFPRSKPPSSSTVSIFARLALLEMNTAFLLILSSLRSGFFFENSTCTQM
jgi:Pyruvate/2-oxoacid:ferredoxin oxidoreductase delta subunit